MKVSKAMLRRLPGYLNYLKSLPEDASANISATTLAKAMNLGDVLVRKDLATVSQGGRRRTGHLRENLIRDIEEFLDYNSRTSAIVIGVGKLGRAILDYDGFDNYGIRILAGFDIQPERARQLAEKPIYAMSELQEFCLNHSIRLGIITVPASQAQEACNMLTAMGVKAIWNFAPTHLVAPQNVFILNENLEVSLTTLRIFLRENEA